jgi:hypothetical protein
MPVERLVVPLPIDTSLSAAAGEPRVEEVEDVLNLERAVLVEVRVAARSSGDPSRVARTPSRGNKHRADGCGGGAIDEMNLVAALAKVLDGKTMSVTDVSEAVQKAGYKTTSPSFRTIVNQTLINSGKFKRIERGQYTAK